MGSDARHQPIAGEQSDAMQSYPLESGKDARPGVTTKKLAGGKNSGLAKETTRVTDSERQHN